MVATDAVARLGAEFLLNKYSVVVDGKYVVVAQFEDAELVLTPEGLELAAAAPAKTPRVRKITAVESVAVASDASVASAPVEAPQSDAAPTE